jgi:diguanylate cyclase (GGDEF)-like protein
VQVSHRFTRNWRERSGRVGDNTFAGFHTSLLEVLPHAAAYIAHDGSILVHNKLFEAACATKGVDILPSNLEGLLSETSWRRCEAVLSAAFAGVPAEASGAILLQAGGTFCHHMTCTSFVSLTGERKAVLVQFELKNTQPEVITDRAVAVAQQPATDKVAGEKGLLQNFPDDVLVFDGSESVEEKALILLEVINSDRDLDSMIQLLASCESGQSHTIYISERSGSEFSVQTADRQVCEVRLVPMPSGSDDMTGREAALVVIRRNVDSPEEVAENRRLAYQDALTGLENRRAFTRALNKEMSRMTAEDEAGLAVFYIDLDEFKKVNDLGGHDAGDEMLLRVAACLRLTLGEFGTAARIGGDEFACMLPVANEEAALEVAESILESFDRIRLEVADRVFTIGGSVGVAYVENGFSLGKFDAAALLGLADRACLRGKRVGGRSVQIHVVQSKDYPAPDADLVEIPEPCSFSGNDLTLYSMPITCLKQNKVCGIEVLLRLQGARAEGMSSRAWISAAERYGFMAQVDAWTLDRVLDAAERNPSRSLITMNVSAESARDPNFRDGLFHRLSGNQILASKLCLEIAEKDFLREPATVESFFRYVTGLGCQTALDDFAGHWPVLSRLTGLRVECLKLEAGLTQQVVDEPAKAAILNGLVNAAHELGIKVMAKHVETAEEARLLRDLNIDAAQGFYFGKPEPWLDLCPETADQG